MKRIAAIVCTSVMLSLILAGCSKVYTVIQKENSSSEAEVTSETSSVDTTATEISEEMITSVATNGSVESIEETTTEESIEVITEDTSEVSTEQTTENTSNATDTAEVTEVTEESITTPAAELEITPDPDFNPKSYMRNIDYSGSVLVAINREVVFNSSIGDAYVDLSTGTIEPILSDTVFEMGSITKQFTAVAIMQLEEQGLLSTEDTLDKYIPEYPYADKVTIHQLLNMTSGIVDYITDGPMGYDLYDMSEEDFESFQDVSSMFLDVCAKAVTPIDGDDIIEMVSPYELQFEPGSKFHYSNTNYYFLGMIIERLTGMNYADYVRTNILDPLNLTELWPDIAHLTSDGAFRAFGLKIPVPHQDSSISYAVGVMTGTTRGLMEWEFCVLDRKLLTEESWNKILDGGKFGYGYGWYINDNIISHSGMTLGYNAEVMVNLENEDIVIALSNVQAADFKSSAPASEEVAVTLMTNIDTMRK